MVGLLKRLFGWRPRSLSDDRAQALANHPDPRRRADLARRADLRPDLLVYLAGDRDPAVRRAVALNPAAPVQVNLRLAADDSELVRGDLAAKIARLGVGLSAEDRARWYQATSEALEIVARDQVARVRLILAEALMDVADAPPEVMRRLARDAELAVSGPVLRFSPALTDEDLLQVIGASPVPGALTAISHRAGLNGPVCDAIAASNDIAAITVLLGNPLAQIREETLDRLTTRAADIEAWHRPLVERPRLSSRATQRLARFVAADLLRALAERDDLDPQAAAAVAVEVERRLAESAPVEAGAAAPPYSAAEAALARARLLQADGKLTAATIEAALLAGDAALVEAALTLLGRLPLGTVAQVVATQSAKGIIAVTWRAGLPAGLATLLQTRLLHLPPGRVLAARSDGSFPLSTAELMWQIEFFGTEEG